jgi:hypothetical protein
VVELVVFRLFFTRVRGQLLTLLDGLASFLVQVQCRRVHFVKARLLIRVVTSARSADSAAIRSPIAALFSEHNCNGRFCKSLSHS